MLCLGSVSVLLTGYEAEYRGWELTRVRLYTDGSRRVLLRRKKSHSLADQPEL